MHVDDGLSVGANQNGRNKNKNKTKWKLGTRIGAEKYMYRALSSIVSCRVVLEIRKH
jgi:hypothetical protein